MWYGRSTYEYHSSTETTLCGSHYVPRAGVLACPHGSAGGSIARKATSGRPHASLHERFICAALDASSHHSPRAGQGFFARAAAGPFRTVIQSPAYGLRHGRGHADGASRHVAKPVISSFWPSGLIPANTLARGSPTPSKRVTCESLSSSRHPSRLNDSPAEHLPPCSGIQYSKYTASRPASRLASSIIPHFGGAQ